MTDRPLRAAPEAGAASIIAEARHQRKQIEDRMHRLPAWRSSSWHSRRLASLMAEWRTWLVVEFDASVELIRRGELPERGRS